MRDRDSPQCLQPEKPGRTRHRKDFYQTVDRSIIDGVDEEARLGVSGHHRRKGESFPEKRPESFVPPPHLAGLKAVGLSHLE